MRKNRTPRSLGVVCVALTTALLGLTACDEGSTGADNTPAKTRETLKPTSSESTKSSATPSRPQSSTSTGSSSKTPSPSTPKNQQELIREIIRQVDAGGNLADIGISNNATCNVGDTLTVTHLRGNWEDSAYGELRGFSTSSSGPFTYEVLLHTSGGSPVNGWTFACTKAGYHRIQFAGLDPAHVQATEYVTITVNP